MPPKKQPGDAPAFRASRRQTQTAESVALTDEQLPLVVRAMPVGDAAHCIGVLRPGCRISGLTFGQFSLLDMMKAVIDQIGPCDCLISAWTVGIRDGQIAGWWLREKRLRSVKIWVDAQFPKNEPAYCQRLVEVFGPETFTLSTTHAKFVVLKNEKWSIVIRSSMNLNKNPRLEQFDLDDSPQMAAFYLDQHARYLAAVGPGAHWSYKHVTDGQRAAIPPSELDLLLKAWEEEQDRRIKEEEQLVAAPVGRPPTRRELLEQDLQQLSAAMVQAVRKGGGAEKVSAERRKVHAELEALDLATKSDRTAVTPAEAADQLVAAAESAPAVVQFRVYQALLALHPDWAEADDDE